MMPASKSLFVMSFTIVSAFALVPNAQALWRTYSPVSCQVDNGGVAGYLTNGALENKDTASHHYYCPAVEDSYLDLRSATTLDVYVLANYYSTGTVVEARSCLGYTNGSGVTCGSYAAHNGIASGAAVTLSPSTSSSWALGSTSDNYYTDVVLYPPDSDTIDNTIFSISTSQ
jgi:hypothetical protein